MYSDNRVEAHLTANDRKLVNKVGSVYGKFSGEFPNDGITGEFSGNKYAHSADLNSVSMKRLKKRTRLFRRY